MKLSFLLVLAFASSLSHAANSWNMCKNPNGVYNPVGYVWCTKGEESKCDCPTPSTCTWVKTGDKCNSGMNGGGAPIKETKRVPR